MLIIKSAFYDTNDVKNIISSFIRNDSISIKISNDILGGDPSPNKIKNLVVEYELDGNSFSKTFPEETQLIIGKSENNIVKIKNDVDIIIPFKNSDIERVRNLFFTVKYYKKFLPDSNVIIVEQDTITDLTEIKHLVSKHINIFNIGDFFNRSYMFNQGFNLKTSKYLILADGDCIVDKEILINFDKYKPLFDKYYVIPYNKSVLYLSLGDTLNFINNDLENNGLYIKNEDEMQSVGGVGIISSDIYYRIGGYDERYKGWGFEDSSFFNHKCIGLNIKIERIGSHLIHLWHPLAKRLENYYNNSAIYDSYSNKNTQDFINELGYSHLSNDIDYSKIKIVTNYSSNELVLESENFYKNVDLESIKIDGRTGMYGVSFFEHIIKNLNSCDWMIYIDEDCFITDVSAMLDLLFYQIENNIAFSGMPDGGVISHRFHNPISINAFFTIINLKMLRNVYNGHNQLYGNDLDKFIPLNLIKTDIPEHEKYSRTIAEGFKPYGVIYDNFEPYYKVFFSLLRNGGIPLYLDANDSDIDDLTTVLKNHKGVEFAYHTWFARSWTSKENKDRILNVINYCNSIKK